MGSNIIYSYVNGATPKRENTPLLFFLPRCAVMLNDSKKKKKTALIRRTRDQVLGDS